MRHLALIVWISIAAGSEAFAQGPGQDSLASKRLDYFFQIQSGPLIGCSSCDNSKDIAFSGATIHGIKFARKWRAGLGVGFDSYLQWNTMPIFGHLGWDVIGRKNKIFIELNYGRSLASWRNVQYPEYGLVDSKGGSMYGFGAGYRINYEKINVSLGIGHKTQQFTTYYEYPTYYWDFNNYVMGEPTRRTVKTDLNRLMIWFAVGWN